MVVAPVYALELPESVVVAVEFCVKAIFPPVLPSETVPDKLKLYEPVIFRVWVPELAFDWTLAENVAPELFPLEIVELAPSTIASLLLNAVLPVIAKVPPFNAIVLLPTPRLLPTDPDVLPPDTWRVPPVRVVVPEYVFKPLKV
jgi:hypothetical protein